VAVKCRLSFKFPNGAYPVYFACVVMIVIKSGIEFPIEVGYDTTRDSYREAEDVDEDEHFVLHHTAKCNQQVIFDHEGGV
jgi:hypothetical protein